MTPEILLTISIILMAVILFATEKLRVDIVALLVLLVISITGLVSKEEVFLGFANSAVITIWAVYIVSGGLFKTGVADALGSLILRLSGTGEARLIAVIMLICGILSAFMNNVGAVAVLMPAVIGISKQTRIPVSKLLIPLAFSSLLGGKITLIGTPANILAQGVLVSKGLQGFSFFEITPMGLIVLGTGIIYMVIVGRHLLPVREAPSDSETISSLREYISEVQILPNSSLNGKRLFESDLGAKYDLTVLSVVQDGKPLVSLHRDYQFQEGDLLIIKGSAKTLLIAQSELLLKPIGGHDIEFASLETEQAHILEATLAPRSTMVGRSLKETRFRDRFGFTALAIWRHGEVITNRLRDEKLQFGDTLLLQGPPARGAALKEGNEFLVLEPMEIPKKESKKAFVAAGIMLLVILLAIFTQIGIATAMVLGSVLMVLTGCLTMDEAYESIDWRTVFLVGGMLSLGIAMENTGTAQYLADLLFEALGRFGPYGVLAGIYLLSALITQPMSNAAAIVLIVPIAIDTAQSMQVNYMTFTMAVVIGAATSFLTPVGHKANVLVFGPGGYRFFDYTRVGLWLTIALFIVSMIFLPIIWPL